MQAQTVTGRLSRRAFVQSAAGLSGLMLLSACGTPPPPWFSSSKPRVPRVTYVISGSASTLFPDLLPALHDGLRDLGYELGTNLIFDFVAANGQLERLPVLIQQQLSLPVDVLITLSATAALAAKAATTTTPVVFVLVNDPVGVGLVASLSRPGGNVTGVSTLSGELTSKKVELLKGVLPGLDRLAVLWRTDASEMVRSFTQAQEAASALGISSVLSHGVGSVDEIPAALDDIAREHPQALLAQPTAYSPQVVEFGASHRLPVMFSDRTGAVAGGLMGLGPNYAQLHRRTAWFVDRILKGTRPADLPVEQPTEFEFVVNRRTAEELGITLPSDVATQVTKWVE